MAATTLAEFVTALQSLSIEGVQRVYTYPPQSVTTADLPALWVNEAKVREQPAARSGCVWPVLTATLYLVVTPIPQGATADAWADMVSFMDSIRTQLRTADLTISQVTIEARTDTLLLNQKLYWIVVIAVEGQG